MQNGKQEKPNFFGEDGQFGKTRRVWGETSKTGMSLMSVLISCENYVIYRIRDLRTIAENGVGKAKTEKDTLDSKHLAKKSG